MDRKSRKELDDGRPEDVVDALSIVYPLRGTIKLSVKREIVILRKIRNGCGMRTLEKEDFVGSGGGRSRMPHVVGQRLKQSGSTGQSGRNQYYRPALQYSE